jgi:hypothetical protein
MIDTKEKPVLDSIAIVIPYFGKWPIWMAYYLETCRFNSTINWIFYTDCGALDNLPANVKVVDISYRDYCDLVSSKLGVPFHPENPYKLCDIKPLLGYLHADELDGFDFWAFGDIDLIYGDLRAYFTQARLCRKDLFSTHARRISGHLCLIRNTDEMRVAFKRVKNWEALISKPEHVAFDEKAFSKVFLRHKNSPKIIRTLASVFDRWLKKAEFVEAYSTPNAKIAWVDGTNDFPRTWYWKDGVLANDINGDRAFPYFHFMVWKSVWKDDYFSSQVARKNNPIESFTIGIDGMYLGIFSIKNDSSN